MSNYFCIGGLIIKPKALKLGDTLGVIAPASPALEEKTELARLALKRLGFNVKMGRSCYTHFGYLAGSNALRAHDINSMFANNEVDGIICLKGGYGTPKLLNLIDYDRIIKNPKVFIGYSDITAIHIALNQICGLITFHGPMAVTNMADGFNGFSKKDLLDTITGKERTIIYNPPNEEIKCLVGGEAHGELIGGNLSLITATLGTPYEINTKGKILFLEETNERPYKIDRMLTQLYLAGKLQQANGILLGDWNNCVPLESETSQSLMEVFEDIIIPLNKPTLFNLKAGHCSPMITLPLGVKAYMNASQSMVMIMENSTVE